MIGDSGSRLSVGCAASAFMGLYLFLSMYNLYRLMYPLTHIDISTFHPSTLVRPLWKESVDLRMKVYLSSHDRFSLDFLAADNYKAAGPDATTTTLQPPSFEIDDTVLLWDNNSEREGSFSKSFLLTTLPCSIPSSDEPVPTCASDASYDSAMERLRALERKASGGILAELNAGEGIESTSVILSTYEWIQNRLQTLIGTEPPSCHTDSDDVIEFIKIPSNSSIWKALQANSTVHVHVLLIRRSSVRGAASDNLLEERKKLGQAAQTNRLLLGHVNLLKWDEPHHINPPGRILANDVIYVIKRYLLWMHDNSPPPWQTHLTKPVAHRVYETSVRMKKEGQGYPFWKPQVSVKYVNDPESYPREFVGLSGMDIVQVKKSKEHPSGLASLPALYVDEMGLTSEKYIPINATITSLPLRISFDRSDVQEAASTRSTEGMTAGSLSPPRWRLLTHLSGSIESQKELGFEQSDIDDLRRLVADTNVTLLAITVLASGLHLLFEFLTFKSEVSFWSKNTDLTGLSVRSLFLDAIGQIIILLYLIEKQSSLLMTIPTGFGCLIALWKCQCGAGFKFVRVEPNERKGPAKYGEGTGSRVSLPAKVGSYIKRRTLAGYELKATRLDVGEVAEKSDQNPVEKGDYLRALTIETDRIATRTLGSVLLPLVIVYTTYTFLYEEHLGWYAWFITSAASAVYALGFVLMTPQLFLNYKLKSVAHLPWRVLCYKFLNTFIDDLFALLIRLPTMARISCFRDDVVFFVYLYQRWMYPVDSSRPVEGGSGRAREDSDVDSTKKEQ